MAGMSGAARALRWLGVIVAAAVSIGLIALVVIKDLNTASLAASVVGAIAGIAGAVFAAVPLFREPVPGGGAGIRRVRAGRGAIAAGGDITGKAIGANSKVTGQPASGRTPAKPGQDSRDIKAGRDSIAAGGDITGNAIGEGSTVE